MAERDVKQLIKTWFLEDGFRVEDQVVPEENFRLTVTDSTGLITEIVQPCNQRDRVRIMGSVGSDPAQNAHIERMDGPAKSELVWDIRFFLLSMNLAFTGIGVPFQRSVVSAEVFYDGLTKDNFMQRWNLVRNGTLGILWTIARRLGEVPPLIQSSGMVN